MTILDTAKMTSKGQVTIPNQIRKILHLQEGASVAFGVSKEGIVLLPCEVTAKSPYTTKEWAKIEKLASVGSKVYHSPQSAKRHVEAL